jgi:hypothetical protein
MTFSDRNNEKAKMNIKMPQRNFKNQVIETFSAESRSSYLRKEYEFRQRSANVGGASYTPARVYLFVHRP